MKQFHTCAHLGYLYIELPLRSRFAAAARDGFRFIEHPSPYELPAAEFSGLCRDNGLKVIQIALPAGNPGEKGLAALSGREEEFRAGVAVGIAYAKAIGCNLIHPMAGVPAIGVDDADIWPVYLGNLNYACKEAAQAGLRVIIEPIGAGTLAGYFMNLPAKALHAVKQLDQDNLFIQFDAFHAWQNGVDPVHFTQEAGHYFKHVQIADDPGRHEPGTGSIAFDAFFEALDAAGYTGTIGLEYKPAALTSAGLIWTGRYERIVDLSVCGSTQENSS